MLKVLKSKLEISEARACLVRSGLNCLPGRGERLLRAGGLCRSVAVGDIVKSWDMLQTLDFLREHVPASQRVLDVGAFASEVIPALEKSGYTDIHGIDLNPDVVRMPSRGAAHYRVGNYYEVGADKETFDAITAISVIEHGYSPESLLQMLHRSLREGGYFLASFDYWPQKIETQGLEAFGMSWTVLSRDEVQSFIRLAGDYGLHPVGALDFTAQDKTINWNGREYTFAWLAMQKQS